MPATNSKRRSGARSERVAELERHIARPRPRSSPARPPSAPTQKPTIERLTGEEAEIAQIDRGRRRRSGRERGARCGPPRPTWPEAEAALGALQAQISDLNARRAALERAVREECERAAPFAGRKGARRARPRSPPDVRRREHLASDDSARAMPPMAEDAVHDSRGGRSRRSARRLPAARDAEGRLRQPLNEAERKAQRSRPRRARWRSSLPRPRPATSGPRCSTRSPSQKGFETALGAALGDDLDASTERLGARRIGPIRRPGDTDPPLPEGVTLARRPVAGSRQRCSAG